MTYPIDIIREAKMTGYYRSMDSRCLMSGQSWIEDQMTGESRIDGAWDKQNGIIGYAAWIELWTGYKATLFIQANKVPKKGNAENYVLSQLIKTKGIQNYQGEIKHESNCND